MGTYSGSCFKAIDFSYQVSVSKPNALVLGCRHRLIVLDHKSEKYLAFPLKCGIVINSIAGRDFHPCCKARSLPTPSENGSDAKGSPQCTPTNTS